MKQKSFNWKRGKRKTTCVVIAINEDDFWNRKMEMTILMISGGWKLIKG